MAVPTTGLTSWYPGLATNACGDPLQQLLFWHCRDVPWHVSTGWRSRNVQLCLGRADEQIYGRMPLTTGCDCGRDRPQGVLIWIIIHKIVLGTQITSAFLLIFWQSVSLLMSIIVKFVGNFRSNCFKLSISTQSNQLNYKNCFNCLKWLVYWM